MRETIVTLNPTNIITYGVMLAILAVGALIVMQLKHRLVGGSSAAA